MNDEVKRGPGRPRREDAQQDQPGTPGVPEMIDERETTQKPTDGRPQQVGYVDRMPNHPDFHDNPLVEISNDHEDYAGVPGPKPKGTTEVEILRRYVPLVKVNEAGNAVSHEGSFKEQPNKGDNQTLEKGRVVRLPNKEAARLVKAGIATTTDNSFDDED